VVAAARGIEAGVERAQADRGDGMMFRKLMLAASAVLGVGSPAQAGDGFKSGNLLLDNCNGRYSRQICIGYVTGAVDAAVLFGWKAGCSDHPGPVEAGQFVDIVVNYLNKHPEKRHFDASGLVLDAVNEAFPCNK
jgi:hypothetical protein